MTYARNNMTLCAPRRAAKSPVAPAARQILAGFAWENRGKCSLRISDMAAAIVQQVVPGYTGGPGEPQVKVLRHRSAVRIRDWSRQGVEKMARRSWFRIHGPDDRATRRRHYRRIQYS
jgi:hypothetical protein